jgi:hypothetical protein
MQQQMKHGDAPAAMTAEQALALWGESSPGSFSRDRRGEVPIGARKEIIFRVTLFCAGGASQAWCRWHHRPRVGWDRDLAGGC